MPKPNFRFLTACLLCVVLAACGGSGGGSGGATPVSDGSSSDPAWLTGDGGFGTPATTFTLPATLAGKITADSIYLSDIQATFPAPGSGYAGIGAGCHCEFFAR